MLTAGCAEFDSAAPADSWTPTSTLHPKAGPQPKIPEGDNTGRGKSDESGEPSDTESEIPPPDGCKDHDDAVIATCLDTVSTVAALPSSGHDVTVLAGERDSGKVYSVSPDSEPTEIAELDVDTADGGGLTGLAPSPTYREDRLIFAYITTKKDNRIVRFSADDEPEPVLTGIPKGSKNNGGALEVDDSGALLVATGNAGDTEAADDDDSLAGKVLRIDTSGKPAKTNPDDERAISSGLHAPGGLCTPSSDSDGRHGKDENKRLWVTDQRDDKDTVHLVKPGEALGSPAWTWSKSPGLAGCVEWSGVLSIATTGDGDVQNLPIGKNGSVTGKPETTFGEDSDRDYGKLAGMDLISPKLAVVGTVNKSEGDPVSSDDRVVLIPRTASPTANRS